jgi:hypothetical protein
MSIRNNKDRKSFNEDFTILTTAKTLQERIDACNIFAPLFNIEASRLKNMLTNGPTREGQAIMEQLVFIKRNGLLSQYMRL